MVFALVLRRFVGIDKLAFVLLLWLLKTSFDLSEYVDKLGAFGKVRRSSGRGLIDLKQSFTLHLMQLLLGTLVLAIEILHFAVIVLDRLELFADKKKEAGAAKRHWGTERLWVVEVGH